MSNILKITKGRLAQLIKEEQARLEEEGLAVECGEMIAVADEPETAASIKIKIGDQEVDIEHESLIQLVTKEIKDALQGN
jgi:hypothetical protein